MFDDLDELYQEVIREHSSHPHNFRALAPPALAVDGHNPLCGDQIRLFVAIEDGRIKDIGFTGQGCAISKASASMMTDALKGRSRAEAHGAFEAFQKMIMTGQCDAGVMGRLAAFSGVYKYPARVKCAMLAWHAALAAVDGGAPAVTTEEPSGA